MHPAQLCLNCNIKLRKVMSRLKEIDGQVIIFGKEGHAEVTGLAWTDK